MTAWSKLGVCVCMCSLNFVETLWRSTWELNGFFYSSWGMAIEDCPITTMREVIATCNPIQMAVFSKLPLKPVLPFHNWPTTASEELFMNINPWEHLLG